MKFYLIIFSLVLTHFSYGQVDSFNIYVNAPAEVNLNIKCKGEFNVWRDSTNKNNYGGFERYIITKDSSIKFIKAKFKSGKNKFKTTYNTSLSYRRNEDWVDIPAKVEMICYENNNPRFYHKHANWIGVQFIDSIALLSDKKQINHSTLAFLKSINLEVDSTITHVNSGWGDGLGNELPADTCRTFLLKKTNGDDFKDADGSIAKLRNSKFVQTCGAFIDYGSSFSIATNQITIHWINPQKDKIKLFNKYDIRIKENSYKLNSDCCGTSYHFKETNDNGYAILGIVNKMNKSGDFIASLVSTLEVFSYELLY